MYIVRCLANGTLVALIDIAQFGVITGLRDVGDWHSRAPV
jgi:hypothetical protein